MDHTKKRMFLRLNRYIWTMAIVWTLVLSMSLAWNLIHTELNLLESARIQARTAYQKDIHYRRWNSMQGGVFVPVTDQVRPNPYLDAADRDLTSISGRRLTLINPAYMLRMVQKPG